MEMEKNPDDEFDYYLTEKLGWQSVDTMRASMPNAEWIRWTIYYGRKAQRRELGRG